MSARNKAYLLLLIVSIIWGFAGPIIKFTLHDFPPLVFLAYRFSISSLIALAAFSTTQPKWPSLPKAWSDILIYSLLAVTFGLGLLFYGFDKTTSLTGSLISALSPIAVAIAGALILKEHVTKIERLGITIAFAGTVVIVLQPFLASPINGTRPWSLEGNTLILASLIVDTIASLFVKKIVRTEVAPSTLTHLSFIIGFITIAPLAILVHGPQLFSLIWHAPLSTHLGVWYMAVFSGTLAYSLRNRAVKTIEVSEATVFSYLYPLWAAPLSIWWLKEPLTPVFLLGAAIIALGVWLAEHRPRTNSTAIRP